MLTDGEAGRYWRGQRAATQCPVKGTLTMATGAVRLTSAELFSTPPHLGEGQASNYAGQRASSAKERVIETYHGYQTSPKTS